MIRKRSIFTTVVLDLTPNTIELLDFRTKLITSESGFSIETALFLGFLNKHINKKDKKKLQLIHGPIVKDFHPWELILKAGLPGKDLMETIGEGQVDKKQKKPCG